MPREVGRKGERSYFGENIMEYFTYKFKRHLKMKHLLQIYSDSFVRRISRG